MVYHLHKSCKANKERKKMFISVFQGNYVLFILCPMTSTVRKKERKKTDTVFNPVIMF